MSDKYIGWSNRETWALALHIDNTKEWCDMRREWAEHAKIKAKREKILDEPRFHLADFIKDWDEEVIERVHFEPQDATKDERMLAHDVGSLWRVDYDEIARNWLSEE